MRLLTRIHPDFLSNETDIQVYFCKGLLELSDPLPSDAMQIPIDSIEFGEDYEQGAYMHISLLQSSDGYTEYDFQSILIVSGGIIKIIIQEDYRQRYSSKNLDMNLYIYYDRSHGENQIYTGKIILKGFIGNSNYYRNTPRFQINTADEAAARNGFVITDTHIEMSADISVAFQGISMSHVSPILTVSGITANGDTGIFMIVLHPDSDTIRPLWINPAKCIFYDGQNSLVRIQGYRRIPKTIYGDLDITDIFGVDYTQVPNMSGYSNYIISYENNHIKTDIVKDIPTYINGGSFTGQTDAERAETRELFIKRNLPNFDKKKFVVFQTEDFITYIDYYSRILSIYDRKYRVFSRYLTESFNIFDSLYGFIVKVEYEVNQNFEKIGKDISNYIIINTGKVIASDYNPKYKIFGRLYVPTYQKSVRTNLDEEFTYVDSEGNEQKVYFNRSLIKGPRCMNARYLRKLIYMP